MELYASLMASRASRTLPFFSFLIAFFFITTNSNSVNRPPPCASFDCGDGAVLGYPFYPQNNRQSTFCGYPKFAVSCTNNRPILQIGPNNYRVKTLNSSENTVTVTYDVVSTCPVAPRGGFSLEANYSLNYSRDNKMVHFYYNCTLYPPSVPNIKCLQRGAKHSYAFVDGSVPEFNWIQYCESIVTVPVIEKAVDGLTGNGPGDALGEGFRLTWKASDGACQLCEESGGFCGYGSNSVDPEFSCFCNHGNHNSKTCLDEGNFSLGLGLNCFFFFFWLCWICNL